MGCGVEPAVHGHRARRDGAGFVSAHAGKLSHHSTSTTDQRRNTATRAQGSRGKFAIERRISEPDTRTENFAAQEKETSLGFGETEGESKKNPSRRIRSVANAE